jgi:hypothetical protein
MRMGPLFLKQKVGVAPYFIILLSLMPDVFTDKKGESCTVMG